MKYLTIAGVAVLLLLVVRAAAARQADPTNPANWTYIKGYEPGTGYYA